MANVTGIARFIKGIGLRPHNSEPPVDAIVSR